MTDPTNLPDRLKGSDGDAVDVARKICSFFESVFVELEKRHEGLLDDLEALPEHLSWSYGSIADLGIRALAAERDRWHQCAEGWVKNCDTQQDRAERAERERDTALQYADEWSTAKTKAEQELKEARECLLSVRCCTFEGMGPCPTCRARIDQTLGTRAEKIVNKHKDD